MSSHAEQATGGLLREILNRRAVEDKLPRYECGGFPLQTLEMRRDAVVDDMSHEQTGRTTVEKTRFFPCGTGGG